METSTSFCSAWSCLYTRDSRAMTRKPCSLRELCIMIVSSELSVNILRASKTYAPTRLRLPTRSLTSTVRSMARLSSRYLTLSNMFR